MSISSPPNYGSPDWQRGYYSPQKEVLTAQLSGAHVVFDVPPNAESLVAFISAATLSSPPILTGVVTGLTYVGRKVADGSPNQGGVWLYDAAPSLDSQMQIGGGSPIDPITVTIYADAGVHIVADVSKVINLLGQQYVIPSVPSTVAGDHPLNELAYFGAAFNTAATVLASPGAGMRYRIFSAQLAPQVAGTFGALNPSSSGEGFLYSGASGGAIVTFPLTGLPLPSGNGVNYTRLGGNGFESVSLAYTTESV